MKDMITKDDILQNAISGVVEGLGKGSDHTVKKCSVKCWEDGDAHLASIKLNTGKNATITYHVAVTEEG